MKLAQTFVKHGEKCAFVSTINRESSAMLSGGTYAETLVWEYDESTSQRGRLIGQGEASADSLFVHEKFVKRFGETGSFEEQEDD